MIKRTNIIMTEINTGSSFFVMQTPSRLIGL